MRALRGALRRYCAPALQTQATAWAALEAKKDQYSTLLKELPADETALTTLRGGVSGPNAALEKAKDKKAAFWKQKHESVESLVRMYEEMMFPVHALRDELYTTWVNRWGINSKILQTKNAKESDMSAWKAEYDKLGEQMKEIEVKKANYVAATFDTEIYNHILNMLRLAGDAPGVKTTAMRVFHDMTDNEITFDEGTKLLLKNICFGDSIHDNSDLLFSYIEYPERGAHTFQQNESVGSIADRVLETVSERHSLRLDHSSQLQKDPVFLLRPTAGETAVSSS